MEVKVTVTPKRDEDIGPAGILEALVRQVLQEEQEFLRHACFKWVMPKKIDCCVRKDKANGKSKVNAGAVCSKLAGIKKKGGGSTKEKKGR